MPGYAVPYFDGGNMITDGDEYGLFANSKNKNKYAKSSLLSKPYKPSADKELNVFFELQMQQG